MKRITTLIIVLAIGQMVLGKNFDSTFSVGARFGHYRTMGFEHQRRGIAIGFSMAQQLDQKFSVEMDFLRGSFEYYLPGSHTYDNGTNSQAIDYSSSLILNYTLNKSKKLKLSVGTGICLQAAEVIIPWYRTYTDVNNGAMYISTNNFDRNFSHLAFSVPLKMEIQIPLSKYFAFNTTAGHYWLPRMTTAGYASDRFGYGTNLCIGLRYYPIR